MKHFVVRWVLLALIYLLFAGQASATEAVAGGIASLLCAVIVMLLSRAGQRYFSLAAPWWRVAGSTGAALASDPWRVAGAVVQGHGGHMDRQPFRPGRHDEAGRRAVVTLATSLAPNGIVTAARDDALLIHRLHPIPSSPDRDWLL